jgi:N-methylhydantoinase A
MNQPSRVAVDVGGTFTDVVELSPAGELRFDKVMTTPASPSVGVLQALAITPAELDRVSMFTHGTTLAINALLTRGGARTAVIGTLGFRDIYLLGRTNRRTNYDITYRPPAALLERHDTFEVPERSRFDGSVHRPLDEAAARAVASTVAERGYESVAVAFLHSYANPGHELRMRELLAEEAPGVVVSLSHELAREYREYERTSTAVLDAYVKPIVRHYLEVLEHELTAAGFTGRFLVTRSAGGAMTAASAREQPVSLILSGPAGGVIGAAAFGRIIKEPNLITIDMGGTSLDASLIVAGAPVLHQRAEFEQFPINTPSLYIRTIGAGGGSIAWLDEAGALQVGPQSAGAEPGPASYGRGGSAPTFTDAALVIGYLGTGTPLGGRLQLDDKLAEAALEPIAAKLELSPLTLARGIVSIATTKITGAVRSITVEVGRDPKGFALLSFGGGGGLAAADVAHELGIPTVIVPPGPGAFSALGMLMEALTTPETPVVAGNFRPLRIITEPGSVMHAVPPMPTFTLWTGLLGGEVILKALAQGMPDVVPACSGGDVCSMMGLGVNPRSGDHWLEATNEAVGFGGHAGGDGADGIMHLSEPGCRNNPVEVLETKAPMFIESYGYRADSGGAGRHRGGVGVTRVYRFLSASTAICLVYKTKTRPWAIAGGREGASNRIVLHPRTARETVQGGSYNYLEAGEVLVNSTGGGGGYGNPFQREPGRVADDVRNGYVSAAAADREYGVILHPETLVVDEVATARRRGAPA